MLIVDDCIWPWQGRRWCHLVSDDNLDELHALAERLGIPRRGFQGDHYDLDEVFRSHAIRLGAAAVATRELSVRLRAAGLRLTPPMRRAFADTARPQLQIRAADPAEPGLRRLAETWLELVAETAPLPVDPAETNPAETSVFVAEDGNRIGIAAATSRGEIRWTLVGPAARGRGVARLLRARASESVTRSRASGR